MLEIRGIKKSFLNGKKKKDILKGVDLNFDSGNFIAIFGSSGSGKTTLLNIIGGLDLDYEGLVIENNVALNIKSSREMNKFRLNNIGFVHQSYNLLNHLNVKENILISQMILKDNEMINRYEYLVEQLNIKELEYEKAVNLSGGEKQRVAIARALINKPKIVLADEPTGSLDYENSKEVFNIFKRIAKENRICVIVVSHDLLISDYCDRKIVIRDGQVLEDEKYSSYSVDEYDLYERKVLKQRYNYIFSLVSSFKYAIHKKWLSLLLALGSSISLVAFILMFSLGFGVNNIVNEELSNITETRELVVYKESSGQLQFFTNVELQKINENENVIFSYSPIEYSVSITKLNWEESNLDDNIFFQNQNTILPNVYKDTLDGILIYGDYPTDNSNQVIVNETVAKLLVGNSSIQNILGQTVTTSIEIYEPINSDLEYVVYDIQTVEFEIVGIVKDNPFEEKVFSVSHDYIKNLYNDTSGSSFMNTTSVTVLIDNMDNMDDAIDYIENLGLFVYNNNSLVEEIEIIVFSIQFLFFVIGAISLLVALIMIGVVVFSTVYERIKVIGTLKAIGFTNPNILRLIVLENAILGAIVSLIASLLGFIIGLILNSVLKGMVFRSEYNLFCFKPIIIIYILIISILMYSIGAFIPGWLASRINPIKALNYE